MNSGGSLRLIPCLLRISAVQESAAFVHLYTSRKQPQLVFGQRRQPCLPRRHAKRCFRRRLHQVSQSVATSARNYFAGTGFRRPVPRGAHRRGLSGLGNNVRSPTGTPGGATALLSFPWQPWSNLLSAGNNARESVIARWYDYSDRQSSIIGKAMCACFFRILAIPACAAPLNPQTQSTSKTEPAAGC